MNSVARVRCSGGLGLPGPSHRGLRRDVLGNGQRQLVRAVEQGGAGGWARSMETANSNGLALRA